MGKRDTSAFNRTNVELKYCNGCKDGHQKTGF